MSAPSSISSSEGESLGPAAGRFLKRLVLSALAAAVVTFGFVLVVDPYGISPIGVESRGFNAIKPKRINIDRQIKPIEVWLKQPATVFMGSSRIHQSIDPANVEGTPLAPAYNASVPANSPGMNIALLDQYIALNPNLKRVYVELFMYNFFSPFDRPPTRTRYDALKEAAQLTASSDAIWDAITTVLYNALRAKPTHAIARGGFFVYLPGHNAQPSYEMFPVGMWAMQPKPPEKLALNEAAFRAFTELVQLAKDRGVELVIIATPNHAYFDHFLDRIDGWPMVEEWLRRMTAIAPIVSFAQPNDWTYERVSDRMTYWYDPFHFALPLGKAMTDALVGRSTPGVPANFMRVLTPDAIAAHVEERRRAIRDWAGAEAPFVAAFEKAHRDWLMQHGAAKP